MTPPRYTPLTPPGSAAAMAAIQIDGARDETEALVRRLSLEPLPLGAVALRDLGGIDTALVARPSEASIILTPHASPIVMRKLAAWLESQGVEPHDAAHESPPFPEAGSPFERVLLATLATAVSPLAIDLLLRQPRLWSERTAQPNDAHDAALGRLLMPPLVVAVGHTNVGKSSLVNALARRTVSVTADMPGTTRDHVGVTLDLAGLVVRWVDTPGFPRVARADPLEAEAIAGALGAIAGADLIVSCADASTPFLERSRLPALPATPLLTCATRADLGSHPRADFTTAAARPDAPPEGLDALASGIRDRLVSPASRSAPIPWRFHPSLA